MKFIHFTILVIIYIESVILSTKTEIQPRSVIKVYYEPLCPTTIRFFKNSLKKFYDRINEFQPYVKQILFYPGGKTRYYLNSNSISFKCLHGNLECIGNKFHACAMKLLPLDVYKSYIFCYMKNIFSKKFSRDTYAVTKNCSNKLNFDYNLIKKCVKNNGDKFLLEILKERDTLPKRIFYVPWVTINDHFNLTRLRKIEKDMTGYICSSDNTKTLPICKNIK